MKFLLILAITFAFVAVSQQQDSSTPEPTAPEPTSSESTSPEPTSPEPTSSEPTSPEPTSPESTSPESASTTVSPTESDDNDEKPQKLVYRPFFPRYGPIINRRFISYQTDDDSDFEQVQNPLEYNFNDRFSVQPYLTFPPNVGGGLNFRYRF